MEVSGGAGDLRDSPPHHWPAGTRQSLPLASLCGTYGGHPDIQKAPTCLQIQVVCSKRVDEWLPLTFKSCFQTCPSVFSHQCVWSTSCNPLFEVCMVNTCNLSFSNIHRSSASLMHRISWSRAENWHPITP